MPEHLAPILKWPGGKEKELRHILPALPAFRRYFEPFVGGGSVFMAVEAEQYLVNDFSEELVTLYRYIANADNLFFTSAEAIDTAWNNAGRFFHAHREELSAIYAPYRAGDMSRDALRTMIRDFGRRHRDALTDILPDGLRHHPYVLHRETETNLFRKMTRMKVLEDRKNTLPDKDVDDNIETAVRSALYMYMRHLHNIREEIAPDTPLGNALFLFIRNYAYSGMFRYNDEGKFNVPYGGMAYNSKTLARKLEYYRSAPVADHMARTQIFNLDFEEFLTANAPGEEDFVFLDPPYDSDFNTYARNEFGRDDQRRLADLVINHCPARWMMVIKNTDFIRNLYEREGINIRTFDKKYLVSFMNRNDKNTTHLVITNY